MKIDPVDVIASSIGSIPIRIILVWLAISLGSILSLICDFGLDVFEEVGFLILVMPIHLIFVACLGDWWVYFSVPLLFITIWRSFKFIINDNTGSDLMLLVLLAYLVTSDFSDSDGIVLRTVFGLLLLSLSVFAIKRNKEYYPDL